MSENNKEKKKRPARKYLFAVLDSETHDFLYAVRGTKHAAISSLVGIVILFCALTFCIVAFTPIKRSLPGFMTSAAQRTAVENAAKVDSMESRMRVMTLQVANIQRILAGLDPIPVDSLLANKGASYSENSVSVSSHTADSILRQRIDSIEKYNLYPSGRIHQLESMLFFTPVKGIITEQYSPAKGHPFVDIAVQNNSTVCAILDGTVIAAHWDNDTGYNLHIQHDNNLVSVYKHLTRVMKKVGDRVAAGTAIALAGEAGTLSTGSHLHFELWHSGEAIDPTLYINF